MALDQRVGEIPLRSGDLDAVSLHRRRGRTGDAELLTLRDEHGDAHRQQLDGSAVAAAPKARWAQVSESWAASHFRFIGEKAAKV